MSYNKNYTREQIETVLGEIQQTVLSGKWNLSRGATRTKNIAFKRDFALDNDKIAAIIQKIKPEDFCHSLSNTNPAHIPGDLFVFCPYLKLTSFEGKDQKVTVYSKFSIVKSTDSGKFVVIVSLHEADKPADYLFTRRKGGGQA
jgi:hypothetical protein